jgi:hypothetical protein
MRISEYENIEIFNKTQSFSINKCENQILSISESIRKKLIKLSKALFREVYFIFQEDKLYL